MSSDRTFCIGASVWIGSPRRSHLFTGVGASEVFIRNLHIKVTLFCQMVANNYLFYPGARPDMFKRVGKVYSMKTKILNFNSTKAQITFRSVTILKSVLYPKHKMYIFQSVDPCTLNIAHNPLHLQN